jgi:hypothetical protein
LTVYRASTGAPGTSLAPAIRTGRASTPDSRIESGASSSRNACRSLTFQVT